MKPTDLSSRQCLGIIRMKDETVWGGVAAPHQRPTGAGEHLPESNPRPHRGLPHSAPMTDTLGKRLDERSWHLPEISGRSAQGGIAARIKAECTERFRPPSVVSAPLSRRASAAIQRAL